MDPRVSPRFGFPLRLALGVAASIAAFGGCGSSTGLTNMWRDPEYAGPPMNDILVVAMRRDPVVRRLWEDGFVRELAEHRIEATPSYRLFPNELPDTAQVLDAVVDNQMDGVLITWPAGREIQRSYVPGYVSTRPVTVRSPWTGFYHTRWRDVYEPGYVTADRLVYNEVQLWDARGEGNILVWAGTTRTINPTSGREVNREIGELIIPELARQGILPQ